MEQKHFISFLKGVSWRFVATCDTILLAYIYTGSIGNSIKIGGIEVFTKIILFYIHERFWLKIKWGTKLVISDVTGKELSQEEHYRSIIKGICWRIVGTLDTITIATFITHDFSQALKIGGTELITKIIFYYFHERAWLYFTKNR